MTVSNIQKATYNGKKVKLFKVWDEKGVFVGKFSAPIRTANKNLLKTISI